MSRLDPPGGAAPPSRAVLRTGAVLELEPLARETARRHREEFPDEQERFGEAGFAWCVHDNQYLLAWAVHDSESLGVDLLEQVRWLAGILSARDYPIPRLRRDLELAADVIGERAPEARRAAERLEEAAASLGSGNR